jgi:serine O-acetyltransferase
MRARALLRRPSTLLTKLRRRFLQDPPYLIPPEVQIGRGLTLKHRGLGVVVNKRTVIGDHVTIYHGVTIGRKDALVPAEESDFEQIVIGDHAVLFPGAVVLGGAGVTRIGTGAVIGANAVVLGSVGDGEIWAGNPARRVGLRDGYGG